MLYLHSLGKLIREVPSLSFIRYHAFVSLMVTACRQDEEDSTNLTKYQITFSSFRQNQEMIFHRHTVFGGCRRRLDPESPQQCGGDDFQLHHCKVLAETSTRPGRERQEEYLHIGADITLVHPPIWSKCIWIRENDRVTLRCIALHRNNSLESSVHSRRTTEKIFAHLLWYVDAVQCSSPRWGFPWQACRSGGM